MNIVELKKRKALCSKPCRAVREERPVLPKGKRILYHNPARPRTSQAVRQAAVETGPTHPAATM
jgi:hypothetical protein